MSTGDHWYDALSFLDGCEINYRIDKSSLDSLCKKTNLDFNEEVDSFKKRMSSEDRSDHKWMQDISKSGTLSDRVAALTMTVQKSPVHNLEALDNLVSMALKEEQRTSQLALEALKDLFIHNLLPDRKLQTFLSRPLGHPKIEKKVLILLWFEDQLIRRFEKFILAIEQGLKSTIDFFKRFCMEIISDLLIYKNENETRLLAMLVNKIGDPKGPVYSKCIEILRTIVQKRPDKKMLAAKEVLLLMHRPKLPPRALHSGLTFLSTISLTRLDSDIAVKLVEGYLTLFEKILQQTDSRSKLLAAVLAGISRSYPYLTDHSAITKHMDAIFRIVHDSSFATSTRALLLLSHIALPSTTHSSKERNGKASGDTSTRTMKSTSKDTSEQSTGAAELTSRYYRALYVKLLSDEVLILPCIYSV